MCNEEGEANGILALSQRRTTRVPFTEKPREPCQVKTSVSRRL